MKFAPTEANRVRGRGALGFRRWTPAIVAFLTIASIWEVMTRLGVVSRFIMPPISEVAVAMGSLAQEGFFWKSVQTTAVETVLGFLVGSAVGFLLGAVSGVSVFVRRGLQPYVVLFQSFPKSALAPTLIIWFGFGISAKVALAATIAFFPLFVNTVAAFDSTSHWARLTMRSYGASRFQNLWILLIPDSLPSIFAGLKSAISLALIGAIVSELIGAQDGLGFLIGNYSAQFKVDLVFASLVYLAMLGLVLYSVVELIDRRIVFWRGH